MGLKAIGSSDTEASPEIMAEINITPLTDIFLVLLIIFMVTSSVMTQTGVEVNLPAASQATSTSQPDGIIVTLLPGGALRVNQAQIAAGNMGEFEGALKSAFSKTQSRLVILEGDRQSYLGSAIEVMDTARRAGADRFAIATTLTEKK